MFAPVCPGVCTEVLGHLLGSHRASGWGGLIDLASTAPSSAPTRPPAGDALEGGMWAVSLLNRGEETAVLSLQEALDQVGADGATVSVLVNSPDEEPSAASQIAFSQSAEVAIEWANAFIQLGVSNADAFRGRAAAQDLAGALCTAGRRPGLADAAATLMRRTDDGLPVRDLGLQ